MIRLSLSRSPAIQKMLVALMLLLPLAGAGCEEQRTCATIACLEGLTISLDGNIDSSATLQVDITMQTPGGPSPVMTCTLSPTGDGGGPPLTCNSSLPHSVLGRTIWIQSNSLRDLTVSVSSSGAVLTQKTFTPAYATREIGGPGCGKCTSASMSITIP